jgi:hypothetical protein
MKYDQPALYDLLGPRFRDWHTASAIVMAESGGDPHARSPNPDGGENRGLFQIDTNTAKAHHLDPNRLFDPQYNAYAASVISGKGARWGAWETYATGAYKKFLKGAKLPGKDSPWGQAVEAAAGAPKAAADAATAVPHFLGKLGVIFDPMWWLRVGQVFVGIAAMAFGVNFFAKEFLGVNPAGAAVKAAAVL